MFKERIKELRKNYRLTQEELAEKIGVSRTAVAGYEQVGKQPAFEVLINIANFFDVSIDYLLGLSDIKNPYNKTLKTDLGLSDEAISYIKKIQNSKKQMLSIFIEDKQLGKFLDSLLMSFISNNKDKMIERISSSLKDFIQNDTIQELVMQIEKDERLEYLYNVSVVSDNLEKIQYLMLGNNFGDVSGFINDEIKLNIDSAEIITNVKNKYGVDIKKNVPDIRVQNTLNKSITALSKIMIYFNEQINSYEENKGGEDNANDKETE